MNRPGTLSDAPRETPLRLEPMPTTVRQAIKAIESTGWTLVRTRGSHRQYRHRDRPGTVTIPGKPSSDLAPGTWRSIRRQAGLED